MYCGGKESPNGVRLTNTQVNAFTGFLKIGWNVGHENQGTPIDLSLFDSFHSLDQSRYSLFPNRMKPFQFGYDLGYKNFLETNRRGLFDKFSPDFNLDALQLRQKIPWPIEITLPSAKILIGFDFMNKYPSEKSLTAMGWEEGQLDDNLSSGVAKQFQISF
ncbi:MAG TPA: hypothetical protein PKW68_04530 [bacterium]|jgi:hypothetical protein|nr:hypothetical protein [bacterium]